MNATLKLFLSGLISAVIVGCTGLMTAISTIPAGTPITDVSWTVWVGIASGAAMAAAKDWRTFIAPPPNTTSTNDEHEVL